jgi:very-short-patch-repair endonuclease
MLGLKFRRQHPLHGFIADFYCGSLRLVLEIDGGVHFTADQQERDHLRTEVLALHGIRVVRIPNEHVTRKHLERIPREISARR